jgi:ring-1,2-phenylacetyl-CoA epoxidase subunit PaaD
VVNCSPACETASVPQPPAEDPVEQALRARIWSLLEQVSDPEIPVISLIDLGVVREVKRGDALWEVVITPTYSGCPAMSQMADDIVAVMAAAKLQVQVRTQLAPAWSTDWISAAGRRKLREYGIAPPAAGAGPRTDAGAGSRVLRFVPRVTQPDSVACPRCGSAETVETSHFGSTACKAMYRCLACREPFDYFKPY